MNETVKLSRVQTCLEDLEYPVEREPAAAAFSDVTLLLADGERNLGDLVEAVDAERFGSADDLFVGLQNVLPVEAVGEPGQSEGDA